MSRFITLAFGGGACAAVVACGQEAAKQPLPDVPGAIKQKECVPLQPNFELSSHVQIVPPSLPRELTATGRKIAVAPSFSSKGEAPCDEDGAAYFHVMIGESFKPGSFRYGLRANTYRSRPFRSRPFMS